MLNITQQVLQIISGEMEYNDSAQNRTGRNAVRTHPVRKRNIQRGFILTITFRIAFTQLTQLNRHDCGYQVHEAESKILTVHG
jgi:hypothetical protein